MSSIVLGRDIQYPDEKMYDIGIISGFARFLIFGLPPGGLEGICISGDYELAIQRAPSSLHFHNKSGGGVWASSSEDVVKNMIEFAQQNLPEEARGGPLSQMRWCRKGGLAGDKDARLLYKLAHDVKWIKVCLARTGISFDWETGEFTPIVN